MAQKSFYFLLVLPLLFTVSFLKGQTINDFAGNHIGGYSGNGSYATDAEIDHPMGVAVDNFGNVYIADAENNVIRKVNSTGIISTVGGSDSAGYAGDGGPATAALLNNPVKIAVDNIGNLYVADNGNSVIRKINTSGVISTIAGNGTDSWGRYTGDGGPATAASCGLTAGVAVDVSGNVYLSDYENHTIRKINTLGIISTIAGMNLFGYTGDGGPATNAKLSSPYGVAVDGLGNVYIADHGNNVVRKVSPSGIISTVAGNGTVGYSGDGGLATSAALSNVVAMQTDAYGNIFIADFDNNVVRKVSNSGVITTVAGNGHGAGSGTGYFSGNGGPATAAELFMPYDVAIDTRANLYIADWVNCEVRIVGNITLNVNTPAKNVTADIYPNPVSDILHIDNVDKITNYCLTGILGTILQQGKLQVGNNSIPMHSFPSGLYNLEFENIDNRKYTIKITKE